MRPEPSLTVGLVPRELITQNAREIALAVLPQPASNISVTILQPQR